MDVSVDCALFGFDGESLKLLLIRQRTESAGELTEAALQMALPGNLVKEDESLDAAAKRVLSELTQLDDVFLKQFHAFGHPDRVSDLKDQQWLRTFREEPKNRVMTVAYYGLVSLHDHTPSPASFAGDVHWTDVRDLPNLAFDHDDIASLALATLRAELESKHISFELLPEKFTLRQLQSLHEVVLDKKAGQEKLPKEHQETGPRGSIE